jgi:hypothetical protein
MTPNTDTEWSECPSWRTADGRNACESGNFAPVLFGALIGVSQLLDHRTLQSNARFDF